MKRPHPGMRVVINTDSKEDALSQYSLQQSEYQNARLLKQLQRLSEKLDDFSEQASQQNEDAYLCDPILDQLHILSKQANQQQLPQLQKLTKLASGRRILNIELKKKRKQHQEKMEKREQIEMFFRQNRIKKLNLDKLLPLKLQQHTLVAKAYPNGKGFVESAAHYPHYQDALAQSDFLNVVKTANRLFYRNYSSLSKTPATLPSLLLSLVWIPILLFVALAITLPFKYFKHEETVLVGLLAVIMAVLFYVSLRTYLDKPNNNNYIEQSLQDTVEYLDRLNQKNWSCGNRVEWKCSPDFMYLQVVFHCGLVKGDSRHLAQAPPGTRIPLDAFAQLGQSEPTSIL